MSGREKELDQQRIPRDDPHVLELLVVLVYYDGRVLIIVMKIISMVVVVVEARKLMETY